MHTISQSVFTSTCVKHLVALFQEPWGTSVLYISEHQIVMWISIHDYKTESWENRKIKEPNRKLIE